MSKFKRLVVLLTVLAMIFSMAGTALAKPEKGKGYEKNREKFEQRFENKFRLDDLDEAPWAWGHMSLMVSKGIFQGRGNGKMAPNSEVNRAELITAAVRLRLIADDNGLDDIKEVEQYVQEEYADADNFSFTFKDSALLEKGSAGWAAPYIYQAIKLGILDNSGKLQPQKAADRMWVAEVLVKAFKDYLYGEENAFIEFNDLSDLPAGVGDYIKKAVVFGLFNGYPDHTFRPRQPLSRAELMTLMGRTDEELQLPGNENIYKGTIAGIEEDQITVNLKNGDIKTLSLLESTGIFLKGRETGVDMLQAGDKVQILTDDNGNADIIWADYRQWSISGQVSNAAEGEITLNVERISGNDESGISVGDTQSFAVASYAVLASGSEEFDYGAKYQLAEGTVAEVDFHGDLAIKVNVLEEEKLSDWELSGQVTAANAGYLWVDIKDIPEENPYDLEEGSTIRFAVAEDAEISFHNQTVAYADAYQNLADGQAELSLTGQTVTAVAVEETYIPEALKIKGRLIGFDGGTVTVWVYDSGDSEYHGEENFSVANNAEIESDLLVEMVNGSSVYVTLSIVNEKVAAIKEWDR